jgi:hypothetical protein
MSVASNSGSNVTFRTDYWAFTDSDPPTAPKPALFALLACGLAGIATVRRCAP